MKNALGKCAGAIIALAILSACANGSAVAPSTADAGVQYIGTSEIPIAGAHPKLRALPSYPVIVPAKVKGKDFEYVFNDYGTYGSMFNYPKSTKAVGYLQGAGGQGCTNVLYGYGSKIIWNAGRTNNLITEYAVPSNKVLKTLSLDYTFTSSCAMNESGDLAVGVLLGNSYGSGGQVVIFKGATGSGKAYKTPLNKEYFDGYDPSGNLFADGFDSSYGFGLVELPKGKSQAVRLKTSNSPQFPGSVQWDGTYVTVFDQQTNDVYRYTISGTTATLKNTVQLSGSSDCAQTWIVKGLIYCGDAGNNDGEVFKYPAGGKPIATFSGNFDFPLGVTAATK